MEPEVYHIPLRKLERVADMLEDYASVRNSSFCKRNLCMMQTWKSVPGNSRRDVHSINFRFQKAIKTAILHHDWDRLLYLLTKWPFYELNNNHLRYSISFDTFVRAYMILMFNHPYARTNGVLMDYFHLVLSCRQDNDKKGLMKILVTLPERIRMRSHLEKDPELEKLNNEKTEVLDNTEISHSESMNS